MIDGHGDDIYRYGDKIRYNFSSNIYQNFDHGNLGRYLLYTQNLFSTYPEPGAQSLERLIASHERLSAENVMATAGSTDSIYLIASLFRGCTSLIAKPSFAEYEDACKIWDHTLEFAEESELHSFSDFDSDLVWLCNPNNPTGRAFDAVWLERTVDRSPGTVFVIDMAYCHYTRAALPDYVSWVAKKNVVFLHSLTKRFGVPGLRVGFVTACREIIERLKSRRIPWSVSTMAQLGAKYLIEREGDYTIPLDRLLSERERLADVLKSMGIELEDSATNFILCRLPYGKAYELKEFLVDSCGALIRDASNFRGLDERCFRISAQEKEMNDILIEGIKEWLCR